MKIIITILVVLLGLGGGAYYAQDSGLYDFNELKQYIPPQVKEILNIENTEAVSVESDELETITDAGQESNSQGATQDEPFGNLDQVSEQSIQQSTQQTEEPAFAASKIASKNTKTESNKKSISEESHQNIQTAMLDTSSSKTSDSKKVNSISKAKSDVQVLDASPEEMKMVNELNRIESKIVKLDDEKEILEKKYNLMIKKNRELAMKIREIDHQIKAINSK